MKRRPAGEYLDMVVKTLPLGTLLLPVSGVAVRWIAFSGDSAIAAPLALAGAAPISVLSATGLQAVGSVWVVFAIFILGIRVAPLFQPLNDVRDGLKEVLDEAADLANLKVDPGGGGDELRSAIKERLPRLSEAEAMLRRLQEPAARLARKLTRLGIARLTRRVVVWAWVFAIVALLAVAPAWPVGLVPVSLGLSAAFYFVQLCWQGRLTFPRASVALVGAMAAGTLTLGLAGHVPGLAIGTYKFGAGSSKLDGRYVELGATNGLNYLRSCQSTDIMAVPPASIEMVRVSRPNKLFAKPSLLGMLLRRGRRGLGSRYGC